MLAGLRQERGLTLESLAQTIRITPDYLRAIEKGQCEPPRPITIGRLGKALSLTGAESEQLHRLADMTRKQKAGGVRLSRPARQLIETIERYAPALPDQFMNTLCKMVREVAEH